jgi:hypothetical protein
MAIIRIQASSNLDFDQACVKAAELLDVDGYQKAVKREALRLGRGKLMATLNKMRESYEDKGFEAGLELGHTEAFGDAQSKAQEWLRNNDCFRVPCSVCGQPMTFSSQDGNWEQEKAILCKAFSDWHHTTCKKTT